MIRAENLVKRYGGTPALDGLSLAAENGSVLGFIGPNGAGKSTAMRILCGIMPPSSGSVSVSGIDMLEFPSRAKERIGYLPENAPLYPGMSVKSFLKYCGRMRGLSGRTLENALGRVVEKCRLEEVLRMDVDTLSKGFRRRTCLAQALIHSPENLVLDEPTDGLDPDQKREIRTLIGELKPSTAILVSTHILEEVGAVCDRVLAIRAGKTVFSGDVAEFRALSPDEGTVVLTLGPEADAAGFENLTHVRSFRFRRLPSGETSLRLTPEKNYAEILLAEAANHAAAHGWRIRGCEILHADLNDVFSRLGGAPQC